MKFIYKIIQWVKDDWKKSKMNSIDGLMEAEEIFIQDNDPLARTHLADCGWHVLGTNHSVISYGYKIQRGDMIHKVSIREALIIK